MRATEKAILDEIVCDSEAVNVGGKPCRKRKRVDKENEGTKSSKAKKSRKPLNEVQVS